MKRPPRTAKDQFTLVLHREPSLQLDQQRKEELLKALADLMLEALGVDPTTKQKKQQRMEATNESKNNA